LVALFEKGAKVGTLILAPVFWHASQDQKFQNDLKNADLSQVTCFGGSAFLPRLHAMLQTNLQIE